MKATSRHSPRLRASSGPGISLFPFLAVLICTMGALVPLLLAITRTARLQAESEALAKASEANSRVQTVQEMARWRIEQLKTSRRTTESQLSDARLELGHIEDHARRLRDQLARYKQTIDDFQRLGAADSRQRAEIGEELKHTQAKIAMAERDLAETRRTAAQRNRCYSVVPYQGPNQTHRRPIYLECRREAVVVQPEGIELVDTDFEGPLGPGNPLAAVLRAAREYMLSHHEFDMKAGEPYPLLLVRPEGIAAYYAAREAMKSWGFDFGYELIDDDWRLSYPPPDARLASLLRQVAASARQEQARLIAAAPREYNRRRQVAYRATPDGGGFVADTVSSGSDDPGSGSRASAGPAGRNLGGGGGSGSGGGNGGTGGGAGGLALAGNSGDVRRTYVGDAPYTGSGPYVAGSATGSMAGGPQGGPAGSRYEVTSSGPSGSAAHLGAQSPVGGSMDQPAFPNGNPPIFSSGVQNGTSTAIATHGSAPNGAMVHGGGSAGQSAFPYGNAATSTGGAQNGTSTGLATDGSALHGGAIHGGGSQPSDQGTGGRQSADGYSQANGLIGQASGQTQSGSKSPSSSHPAEIPDGYVVGQPAHEQVAASVPKQPSGDAGPGQILRPGEWEPAPGPPPDKPKKADDKDKKADRLGKKRTKDPVDKHREDWGLRNAANASAGVARPIRIECYRDRLVVVSDRGPAYNKQIVLGPRTASSVDSFISAIWEQMDGWGIAGRGMYWRPVLEVEVASDAQQRFSELTAQLRGSGLTVTRR